MKKSLILLIAITLFYGCASVVENKSNPTETSKKEESKGTIQPGKTQENKEYDFTSEGTPSLKKIYAQSEKDIKYFQDLESKNLLNTLSKDEQKSWKDVKDYATQAKDFLSPYTNKKIDATVVNFIATAGNEGYSENEIFGFIDPSLVISNPYCEDEFNSFKVFQVLNDSVLADGCEETSYSNCATYSMRIFLIPKIENEIYFDNKILKPESDKCPVYLGTYKYTSVDKASHTVPIVVFFDKKITKMALEDLTEERQKIIKESK